MAIPLIYWLATWEFKLNTIIEVLQNNKRESQYTRKTRWRDEDSEVFL